MPDYRQMIETDRLLLRPFCAGDIDAYAAIRAKPEVVRCLPGGEASVSRARDIAARTVTGFADLWSGDPGYGPWAAIERASGRLIGHLGLRLLPELGNETELLYMLDSSTWGCGYATEGAAAARDYGFDALNLRRLIGLALPGNPASLRVLEKIGMQPEPGLISAFGLELVRCSLERPS